MTKKIVKRTDTNNETLYFYTHSDAVDVGEGNNTTSLTNALNNKANTSDVQTLSNDTLHKSPQSLSSQEKEQVHNNIGTESFVDDRAVRYDDAQVLGSEEKTQALTNLGLNGVDAEPTKNSQKMVRSGGVAGAIDNVQYARFDGIQETSVTLNTTTTATADGTVLFYVPNNVFIYKIGSTYYTLWNNTNRLTNGFYNDSESTSHALTTKIFINTENGLPYSFDGTGFTTVAIDDTPTAGSENLVKSGGVITSIEDYARPLLLTAEKISNGSSPNPGNQYAVHTECMKIGNQRSFIVFTSRPNAIGCHYSVGFSLSSSEDDLGRTDAYNSWQGKVANYDFNSTRGTLIEIPEEYSSAIGISVTIAEYDGTNIQQTLRKSDFDGYSIYLICTDVIVTKEYFDKNIYSIEYGEAEIVSVSYQYNFVSNIATSHPQNNLFIIKFKTECRTSLDAKLNINNTGYKPIYRNNSPVNCRNTWGAGELVYVFDDGEKYIAFDTGRKDVKLKNGSPGNFNNDHVITTNMVFIDDAKVMRVVTNRPNSENCTYRYGYFCSSKETDVNYMGLFPLEGRSSNNRDILNNDACKTNEAIIGDNDKVIAFTIAEWDDVQDVWKPLRVADFDGYTVRIVPNTEERINEIEDAVANNTNTLQNLEDDITGIESVIGQASIVNIGRIINGSQGNGNNAWAVTLRGDVKKAISVLPNRKYKLSLGIEPENGYTFYLRNMFYNTDNPAVIYQSDKVTRNNADNINRWITIDDVIETEDGEYGITIQVLEQIVASTTQASPNTIALRTSDFDLTQVKLLDITDSTITIDIDKLTKDTANLDTRLSAVEEQVSNDIVGRNTDKLPMLINSCRYHKMSLSSKDYQVLICTDSHDWRLSVDNAVAATNGFGVIDALVHCGDIVASNFSETPAITSFGQSLANLNKPAYVVCGNHDVGNCYYVGLSCTHVQAYEAWIKPMVDNGWLTSGEYEVNKPYWFHDDTTYKIRLIGLYEYDDNLDLNETYWKAVEYDANANTIAYNTSYNVGDKVKVSNYTSHGFKCVQAVTTPANYYTTPDRLPSYKVRRGDRVIRQTQAQWFLDVLASTPANYGVIVILHNPFSDTAISLDKKFSWPSNISGLSYTQTAMSTNFIRNAIVAFKNGVDYSEKVVMKTDAAYLNVLNDGTIDYAYEVSKDFSAKNSGVYLFGVLGGHSHRDLIWKDNVENIYQIAPNCARADGVNDRGGDIRRTREDGIAADSLTVVSMASGRIGLVKLGVNVTENGTFRDYEVINTTT